MTDRYDELRAAAEAATPGPWIAFNRNGTGGPDGDYLGWDFEEGKGPPEPMRGVLMGFDMRFVVLARRDTLAILSERDSLLAAKESDGRQKRAYLDEIDRLKDSVEGLTCDLRLAVETAYHRGAVDWTRLNYPKWFAALNPQQEVSREQ